MVSLTSLQIKDEGVINVGYQALADRDEIDLIQAIDVSGTSFVQEVIKSIDHIGV